MREDLKVTKELLWIPIVHSPDEIPEGFSRLCYPIFLPHEKEIVLSLCRAQKNTGAVAMVEDRERSQSIVVWKKMK